MNGYKMMSKLPDLRIAAWQSAIFLAELDGATSSCSSTSDHNRREREGGGGTHACERDRHMKRRYVRQSLQPQREVKVRHGTGRRSKVQAKGACRVSE